MAIQPNERANPSNGVPSNTGTTGYGAGTPRMSDTMSSGPTNDAAGIASQVQDKAEELMTRAGETTRTRIDDGKRRAARELGNVAHALRQSGTDMANDQGMLAPYVNRVADQVERFSTFIDTHSPEDIARNVESFARRNPAVFLGGCFALGMAAARFFKASRPELPVPYGYQRDTLRQTGYPPTMGSPGYDSGVNYGSGAGYGGAASYGRTNTGGFDASSGRTNTGGFDASSGRPTER